MVHGQPSSRVLTSAGPGLGHPLWAQIFWWHYPSYLLPVLSALSREMLALTHQNGIFFKNKKAVFLSSVTLALRLCLLSPNFQQQLPTEAAACVCRFKWLAPQRPPGCGAGWGCVGPPLGTPQGHIAGLGLL